MPKGPNKRVAARQAAIGKKRKRQKAGPRPVVASQPAPRRVVAPPQRTGDAVEQIPEFQAPREAASVPAQAQAPASVPASSRRAIPQAPYLRADLKTTAWLALGMLVILVILDLVVS